MADVSISTLLLFIAALGVAATVSVALVGTVGDVSGAITERGVDVAKNINTEINILTDGSSDSTCQGCNDPSTTDRVRVYVKNTGNSDLVARAGTVDVFIDGTFVPVSGRTVQPAGGGSAEDWGPGEVILVQVSADSFPTNGPGNNNLEAGEHRIKVVTGSESDAITFVA